MSFLCSLRSLASTTFRLLSRLDIQRGRPLRTPTTRASILPILLSTLLFFIWGYAYGLLDTMNSHVRKIMLLSKSQSALLAVAYYAAYPLATFFLARPTIAHCGYRLAFILGISVFAAGNFATAQAAAARSYPGMIASYWAIGLGVAILERSANPYVVRCGPARHRAARINFAQSFAGIGTVVSPLTAAKLLVGDGDAKMRAIVQLYRATGGVVLGIAVIFAVVFFRTRSMPELPADAVPAADTTTDPTSSSSSSSSSSFLHHPIWQHSRLWWGVLANFFNLSCQVTVAQYLMAYLEDTAGTSDMTGAHLLSAAQGAFVLGRFAFVGLVGLCAVRPRVGLAGFVGMALAFAAGAMPARGPAAMAMPVLVMFAEGPLFPTIFETATSALGPRASLAEDLMISSICGGALLPPLFGLLADALAAAGTHAATATAFALVVAALAVVGLYVLLINVYMPYRRALDATGEAEEPEEKGEEPAAAMAGLQQREQA